MERRTRCEDFLSAALSRPDDLLHRNILLLRAISGSAKFSDPGVVAPVPRVPAHARPEAAVPGRRWQGARHGRRAVVQSPRGEEALARRLRAVAHGPPAAMACEQREAGL